MKWSRFLPPGAGLVGLLGGWLLAGSGPGEDREGSGLPSKAPSQDRPGRNQEHVRPEARALARHALQAKPGVDQMRAVIQLANSVPVDQIETWLDENYFDTPDPRLDNAYYEIMHRRFLAADPEAFLRRCLRKGTSYTSHYMELWTRSDPAAAESFMRALVNPQHRQTLGGSLLQELARSDPERALQTMGEWAQNDRNGYWSSNAMRSLARSNRAQLLESASSWPLRQQQMARESVGIIWMEEDFRGGLAWLASQPDGVELFSKAMNRNSKLGRSLRDHLGALPTGWMDRAVRETGYSLVRDEPAWWITAEAQDLGITEENMKNLRKLAVNHLGQSREHREEALAMAAPGTELDGDSRRSLVRTLIGTWDPGDRAGAEAWLDGLGDETLAASGRERLEERVRSESRGSQWGTAPAEFVRELGAEGSPSSSFYQARNWTASGLQSAREAFLDLPAVERDRAADALIANGGNSMAPAMMAEALSHRFENPPPEGRSPQQERTFMRSLCNTASQWGRMNPREAAEWVETLPAGEAFNWAARNLVLSWSQLSPEEAHRWVEGLPVGADLEVLRKDLER